MSLDQEELEYVKGFCVGLVNYESPDPDEPIDPLNYIDSNGDNCLHIAVQRGDKKAACLLLKLGLDVNTVGDMGCTALHYAFKKGDPSIVKILIDHGAKEDVINEFGEAPK